jgi:hypothetical protein
VGKVNCSELRAAWASFFTLSQKKVELPEQCWAVKEGQLFNSLTTGSYSGSRLAHSEWHAFSPGTTEVSVIGALGLQMTESYLK